MNLYQRIAVLVIRLYACWLAVSSLIGFVYSLYLGRFPFEVWYLLIAWLLFRCSLRIGRRLGRELASDSSDDQTSAVHGSI